MRLLITPLPPNTNTGQYDHNAGCCVPGHLVLEEDKLFLELGQWCHQPWGRGPTCIYELTA